jgi:curved DNA-binding protein CbpA
MDFDAYETWLGIPPDRRPPTHYDLLGLAAFESDSWTIDQAALRRMGRVRQHQLGPHSDQSQEILSELARARLILMDSDRRAEYDDRLRARGETVSELPDSPASTGSSHATPRFPAPIEAIPDAIGSLVVAERAGESPLIQQHSGQQRVSRWTSWIGRLAFVASHAALIWLFVLFGGTIAAWVWATYYSVWNIPAAPPPKAVPKPTLTESTIAKKNQATTDPTKGRRLDGLIESGLGGRKTDMAARGQNNHSALGSGGSGDRNQEAGVSKWNAVDSEPELDPSEGNQQAAAREGDRRLALLKEHGLRLVGSSYRLDTEADVFRAEIDANRRWTELNLARMQQRATIGPDQQRQAINELAAWVDQCHAAIQVTDRSINEIPRHGGRFMNNIDREDFEGLQAYKKQLEDELRQTSILFNQLRRQPVDPFAKQRADALVNDKQESYDQALREFRQLLDATKQKYKDLASNDEIHRALDSPHKTTKDKPKIEPSPRFNRIEKAQRKKSGGRKKA